MMHLVMLAIAAAIFALLFAFVAGCDRLVACPEEEIEES
jgi:hypothetical protein